jgi:hypothetical protein
VEAYRDWKMQLEQHRVDLLLAGRKPKFAFDNVLKYLHPRVGRQEMPNLADIPGFFTE